MAKVTQSTSLRFLVFSDKGTSKHRKVGRDFQQLKDMNSSVLQRVQHGFLGHITDIENLVRMSETLAESFKNACHIDNDSTMLPSFISEVPQFREDRTFLALDIGDSTMRAALVHVQHGQNASPRIVGPQSWDINRDVRILSGMGFVRWIVERVTETLANIDAKEFWKPTTPIPIGLTWSFPFQQTSADDGVILKTGKGFRCVDDLVGQKLNGLLQDALNVEGLNVSLCAIVKDTISSFLAHEHSAQNTQISVILGTGLNAAIRLPFNALSGKKLKNNSDELERIIVNTELSLFGETMIEPSIWDQALQAHIRSSCCQPLEYICGGRYLGEIIRLVMIDAIDERTLFNGQMPLGFEEPFSLGLPLAALFEEDDISDANLEFSTQFPLPDGGRPSLSDFKYIKQIVRATSRRAAAYTAVSIHALHSFLKHLTPDESVKRAPISIGIAGSVLTKYPNFAKNCHDCLSEMLQAAKDASVVFNESECPTITGAALAAYIIEQKQNVRSSVTEDPVMTENKLFASPEILGNGNKRVRTR